MTRGRTLMLLVAGIATALAAWLAPDEPVSVANSAVRPVPRDSGERIAFRARPASESASVTAVPNIFSGPAIRAPMAIRQIRPMSPARPVAPPMPFSYVGRLEDTGRVTLFLTRSDRLYAVRLGDVIDGDYRVEALANGKLTLTYLPLKTKQTLGIGNGS